MTAAVMDTVGSVPVAVLVGGDGISIRVYDRRVNGQPIELMARPGSSPARFIEPASGSEFDLTGDAISGPLAGQRLARIHSISEFWFDWLLRHPDSAIHTEWQPRPAAAPVATPVTTPVAQAVGGKA
jgi:hypothetical protein